jgi:N-acetyl sugar amidotransferase
MDSTASNIEFHNKGCNFCSNLINVFDGYEKLKKEKNISNLVSKIKEKSQGKKYNCIVGVSGGLDSSYTLLKAVELGLKPLAVHLDNSWNSELSQNNISNLVNNLNVDLYTHVIEWDEYKKLMKSYLHANVVDLELLTDHAVFAINFQLANKYGLKYILSGTNLATEGMCLPDNWAWNILDKNNILSIANSYNVKKFKTFPSISMLDYVYYYKFKKITWISTLDYLNYDKNLAIDELKKYGYKPYVYKHYESILTRFYQGYILPQKFQIDKRKMFFSTLIISGKMNREEAINELKKPTYPDRSLLASDMDYFLKKLDWSQKDLDDYINKPAVKHDYYCSDIDLYKILFEKNSNPKKVFKILKYYFNKKFYN